MSILSKDSLVYLLKLKISSVLWVKANKYKEKWTNNIAITHSKKVLFHGSIKIMQDPLIWKQFLTTKQTRKKYKNRLIKKD
jgi:hypothetical protein